MAAGPHWRILEVAGESQGKAELGGADSPDADIALVAGRGCGSCSLCCKVLPIQELNKPAGQWCVHSVPGSGCSVHAARPSACRAFFCAWRLDPNLGPEWKPEVSRFVLVADPAHRATMVMVDPGMPLAWKREPYYARLKQFSEVSFRQDRKVLVSLRGQITVILPDREVPIGLIAPGEEIVIWREGAAYAAGLRRDPEAAKMPSEQAPAGRFAPQPAEAKAKAISGTPDYPGFLESVFREAFQKTCELLDDPKVDTTVVLTRTLLGRNKVLDETAETYGKAAGAECRTGCVSCCYLMVSGTPFEILSIARHWLETKTPAEIEGLKGRLRTVAEVPLDPASRVKARIPCALLENGRCASYEQRPSVCRMMLSQSRAACDSCLQGAGGSIPYIEAPSTIAAVMQMGIDYALISRHNLSTERAELSRALLIALADYEGALTRWVQGQDPFPGTHVGAPGAPTSNERTIAAARRLGLG
jgi:Fe-S-cluster containining protein